jgi:ABC-type nitrate/sulfonate/bicarbonate transport system substrate-binding protein
MDITPEARQRLNDLMDARRLELGIPWREVATRAGISYEALRALRAGPGGTADLTARKIDAALGWAPGSVRAILDGGEPVLVGGEDAAPGLPDLSTLDPRRRAILDAFVKLLLADEPSDDQAKGA